MPTTDPTLSGHLRQLTGIVTVLFGLGFASGLYRRLTPSRFTLFKDDERAKTLATAASLTFALLGGIVATAGAAWFLFTYCPADRLTCQPIQAPLWESQVVPGFMQFAVTLYVDRLAAFFALLIAALSIGVTLYSFGWLAGDDQRNRVAGFYNLFVLALLYVVLANHAFFLILTLEVATLAFGYLILYKHNRYPEVEEHRRAITAYLIISQLSTALILAAFLILAYHAQRQFCPNVATACPVDIFSFGVWRGEAAAEQPRLDLSGDPAAATLVFLLAFGGLSIRAGAFPLHFWVSLAHPSSPTTTHAMSLGIGIKIALYLMLRVFFEFLHPTAVWWGWVVLAIGGATAAYNVFFAALAHDLKRALAYHSVENVGIMLCGIGLALAASAMSSANPLVRGLAGIGLIAALYHVLNHAIFKSLLYLCTGIIEKRAGGAVQLRELGGVWRYYPWTALAFLVGAAAIAGLPPFNGFISEWMTLAGLFAGLDVVDKSALSPIGLVALVAGVALLALAFSLTALAFVKIAGRAILGSPHRPEIWNTAKKGDAPPHMLGVVLLLAALCLVFGLSAPPVAHFLNGIARDLGAPASLATTPLALSFSLESQPFAARLSLAPIFGLAVLFAITLGFAAFRARRVRRGRVWVGGIHFEPGRMQTTGAAFSYWLWSRFSHRARLAEPPDHSWRHPPDYLFAHVEISALDRVDGIFRRLTNVFLYIVETLSARFGKRVQSGDIRWYLLYILAAFLVALVLFALRSQIG
ncbi:MAG TPA: proton-conducting transporter membrane subunit [Anaerolineae bacterium]|nr:proton-conducting transporter membrane subunit [Anaerolineae bacterium]